MPSIALMSGAFDLPPLDGTGHGLTAWRLLTSEHFVPLDVHPLCASDEFVGRVARIDRGPLSVFRIEHSPAVVARTPQLIRRSGRASAMLKVSLQVEGDAVIEQDGRVALLHPGDLALYDTSRPYTLRFDTDTRLIVLSFAAGALPVPRDEVSLVTATTFPFESPLGRVVSPFLAGLAQGLVHLPDADGERLAHTALDLLVTVISGELREGVAQDPRRQLRHEVLESIEQMLADPDLSPAQIAERHYISTRHLHALFAEQGITVGSWIRQRRLEHIRRDLADPMLADVPVAQLAARWGLLNAAHFSRLFRGTYGSSPSAYRQSVGGAAPQSAAVPTADPSTRASETASGA